MTRKFTVVVYRKGKSAVSYPARGCQLLDGQRALALMRSMQKRGLESVAITNANGIEETLTLDEMERVTL